MCILRHRGVQLILDYGWERLAILVAGKGFCFVLLFFVVVVFFCCFFMSSVFTLSFLFLFLSCPSLSSTLLSLLSIFSLSQGDDIKRTTGVDVSLNPNTINQCTYGIV